MKQLTLTDTRARLSPTLKEIDRGPVAIKVRGRVAAYLVSKSDYEALVRKGPRSGRLRGSLSVDGDIESFDAESALLASSPQLRRKK